MTADRAEQVAREIVADIDADWTWDGRIRGTEAERATIDAIAAALRSYAGEDWQPIETAPKDGPVIIAVPKDSAGNYAVGEAHYYEDGREEDIGWWWAGEGPGDYHAEMIDVRFGQPTHWRPLPAAPQPDKEGGR